jgi:hypothetical protein
MSTAFVPLFAPAAPRNETGFAALDLKAVATPATPPLPQAGNAACAKPVITLQRSGDTVTTIRIECGCGQVIDLACQY